MGGDFLGGKIDTGFKFGTSGKTKAKASLKVKVKAKAKRELQAVQTQPSWVTKEGGFDVFGNNTYKFGVKIPASLTHEGMTQMASANLMKVMFALIAVLFTLF